MKNNNQKIVKKVDQLQKELNDLKKKVELSSVSIKTILQRRGFIYAQGNPKDNLLLPPNIDSKMEKEFYEMLKKYSYRIFLRDVINNKNAFNLIDLTKFCSVATAKRYLDFLIKCDIIKTNKDAESWVVKNPIFSFGGTLEWFVAQIFEREFDAPTAWGVKLKDTDLGGDYDVITQIEGNIIYVEVKSSPPKHIEIKEIASFLDRINDLTPNMAIFLVDTELRMKDKIVAMFEEELSNRYGQKAKTKYSVNRLMDELFQINHRTYIINSKSNIVTNIGICLKDYFKVLTQPVF